MSENLLAGGLTCCGSCRWDETLVGLDPQCQLSILLSHILQALHSLIFLHMSAVQVPMESPVLVDT